MLNMQCRCLYGHQKKLIKSVCCAVKLGNAYKHSDVGNKDENKRPAAVATFHPNKQTKQGNGRRLDHLWSGLSGGRYAKKMLKLSLRERVYS